MNAKHQRWANALRDKYNKILAQNGRLTEADYENMGIDVEKCIIQDKSCKSALFDVLEEFDRGTRT